MNELHPVEPVPVRADHPIDDHLFRPPAEQQRGFAPVASQFGSSSALMVTNNLVHSVGACRDASRYLNEFLN